MTPKEQVEELQKCADRHRALHADRMKFEYHVLVTALTFYATATWAIVQYSHAGAWIRSATAAGFAFLAYMASALLRSLHASNQINIAIAENYEAQIVELLSLPRNPIPAHLQRKDFNRVREVPFTTGNWGFQCATVWGFALVGILVILTG